MARSHQPASDSHSRALSYPLPIPAALWAHHRPSLELAMRQWQRTRRPPSVLLLTGPTGVGKRELAYYLAQWLLCEASGLSDPSSSSDPSSLSCSLEPCGQCAACLKALHGHWVDFLEIAPESSEENEDPQAGTLKIDQFRELKASQGFSAFDGAYRIILVRHAERMTPQAANSLLKLLEEPPAGWIFFLTAPDPSLLLPTLLSRCQTLRLKPLSLEKLRDLLRQADLSSLSPEQQQLCLVLGPALAQGSWGRAQELCAPEFWEKRARIFRFLQAPAQELSALVEWAAKENRDFQFLLTQLELILFDLLHLSHNQPSHAPGEPAIINKDYIKHLEQHVQKLERAYGSRLAATAFWLEQSERIFRARTEALAPVNRKILIQDLLFPWVFAQSSCQRPILEKR